MRAIGLLIINYQQFDEGKLNAFFSLGQKLTRP